MTAEITIKARDLDTDAKKVVTIEVDAAFGPDEQKSQLARAVESHHPSARLRSYDEGTATFLTGEHLIVASYSRLPTRSRVPRVLESSAQAPLFAR